MQYFNIQMASQLSGVATATIRAWEKRYQVVTPARAENKHRLYSQTDIEKLSLLAKLTDFGQNIGKIAGVELEELKIIYSTLLKKPYRQEDIIAQPKEKINSEKVLSNLSLAVSTFKLDIIAHELKKIKDSLGPRDIALNILSPLIKIMDDKFLKGEITPAHQFALSEMITIHFSYLLSEKDYSSTKPTLILATPVYEPNEINILGAALLCIHYERKILYLGHSVPARILAEVINEINSESLILSASRYQLSDHLSLDQYLDEMNRLLRHSPHLIIQGPSRLGSSLMRQNCRLISGIQGVDLLLQGN